MSPCGCISYVSDIYLARHRPSPLASSISCRLGCTIGKRPMRSWIGTGVSDCSLPGLRIRAHTRFDNPAAAGAASHSDSTPAHVDALVITSSCIHGDRKGLTRRSEHPRTHVHAEVRVGPWLPASEQVVVCDSRVSGPSIGGCLVPSSSALRRIPSTSHGTPARESVGIAARLFQCPRSYRVSFHSFLSTPAVRACASILMQARRRPWVAVSGAGARVDTSDCCCENGGANPHAGHRECTPPPQAGARDRNEVGPYVYGAAACTARLPRTHTDFTRMLASHAC